MFQDFGPLTERRRQERQQRRKRYIIAGASGAAFILFLVVGALAMLHVTGAGHSSATMPSSATNPSKGIHSTTRTIKMLCSSTDYKTTCVSSLSKALNSSSHGGGGGGGGSSSKLQPKDLIKASVAVITGELAQAFSHSDLIKSDDPKVKGAVEDCKELYKYAKDELLRTVDGVGKNVLQQLPKREHDLKTWLSAVMSYQQTCIDGFPEGEVKTSMKKAMKTSKEMTSNALAIIGEASSILSSLDIQGLGLDRRRLLSKQASDKDGFPAWVSDADRRILKQQQAKTLTPNVVVAKDGSGKFKTISDALAAMPTEYKGRYVIYVKEGVYEESPTVTSKMVNVTMYGDGSRKTIVNGNKNFVDGTRTFQTATFAAIGDGFMAIAMGFRNSAGAVKHQAVALRVQSDRSIFLNCRMEGYQDTLYAQTHRQYYRSCVVAGTVDFIFGDAAAVFQNCNLVVRRPLDNQQNIVTAQGRVDRRQSTGFVIQSCRFVADKKLKAAGAPPIRSYLGRPWKEYSRTIIMESTIGDFIHPDGYMPWEGDFALKTLFYGEYGNKGAGAGLAKRVTWTGFRVINRNEALKYTVASFIQGGDWIKASGTPVQLGLYT